MLGTARLHGSGNGAALVALMLKISSVILLHVSLIAAAILAVIAALSENNLRAHSATFGHKKARQDALFILLYYFSLFTRA